jgi:hypothetical protein
LKCGREVYPGELPGSPGQPTKKVP